MGRLTVSESYCLAKECSLADKDGTCVLEMSKNCYDKRLHDKLREYEDLEEQGLLLKLPCKVGDVVYKIYDDIYAFAVTDIYLSKETIVIIIAGKELKLSISLGVDDFCEYVFLTKEEAEKALAEMEK